MLIQFWGVRGTLPVPGQHTLRYGGNTNCISLRIDEHYLIFDAGTGIKQLSNHILKNHVGDFHAKLFITHTHWDHINGLPYFAPLYTAGTHLEIFGLDRPKTSLAKALRRQMDPLYFPVGLASLAAAIKYHSLKVESLDLAGDILVQTHLLCHPGGCLGYRVQHRDRVFCYITDNELYLKDNCSYSYDRQKQLINFITQADVLIIDTTYSDQEYPAKVNWGHACVSSVVELAHQAGVKLLCLHHHDPDQTDDDIDAKLLCAQAGLIKHQSTTRCIAPQEGQLLIL